MVKLMDILFSIPCRKIQRHSGALAMRANPESRYILCICFWIPGPALRAVPE
jgi:hypothetical protein